MKSRIDAAFEGVFEVTALRKDGSTFPMEMEAREVVYRGHALCVCAARDITERRREQEERRRLERHMQEVQKLESLGVLAGGIAHDFNNMLTVILGNCRVALDDLEPDSPTREKLLRARAAGQKAAGLVEQMLTYSGKPSDSRMPLDLSRLVAEMLDLLRASVSEKCALEPDLEANLPTVDGDPSQICQVILNLVINASEAVEEGAGTVTDSDGGGEPGRRRPVGQLRGDGPSRREVRLRGSLRSGCRDERGDPGAGLRAVLYHQALRPRSGARLRARDRTHTRWRDQDHQRARGGIELPGPAAVSTRKSARIIRSGIARRGGSRDGRAARARSGSACSPGHHRAPRGDPWSAASTSQIRYSAPPPTGSPSISSRATGESWYSGAAAWIPSGRCPAGPRGRLRFNGGG